MSHDLSKTAVDCHFHVFEAHQARPGARYAPPYAAPMAAWQTIAGPLGVRRGVLVQTSFMGIDNRGLLAHLAAQPQALRGVAVLPPTVGPSRLCELNEAGVRGLRLNLVGTAHDLSDWPAPGTSFWDALRLLGWHLELHTDLGRLPPVLAQLPPQVPLVIDHMGKPERVSAQDATVRAVRARGAPVHVKLSGAYRLQGRDPGALARLWLGELGPDRLLWGSDWPCTNHEAQADYPALFASLADWLRDDAAVQAARVANPARLYWGAEAVPAGWP
ncbi:amidohydrolase family protein [Ramlibacter sp. 2FC]|uniref:amidohydrolase family protein n=1 Tax=Ramlibacter sp. 2FC TaxID=2502188 RepID=UPI0010F5D29E|nr:amidohydrolase family protein [Ramlibacter sp. 2FC]